MFHYTPERILIDESVAKEPFVERICRRFSDVSQAVVSDYAWQREELSVDPLKNPLTQGKKTLHLKKFSGNAFKPCPGLTEGVVCCNYLTLDFIENCPFECTYCILQAFLNKPVMTVHANISEILEDMRQRIANQPRQLFRIGTGEHSDSLALDPVLEINRWLIPYFAKLPNAVLELKTKSNHVEHLLDLPHGGKTVIAWSINPEVIVEREEHKTARLHERLEAARLASEAGYKVAFHFDPMIHYPGWEEDYQNLAQQLFSKISPHRIAWISMGSLRYIPKLKSIVEERFPQSRVFLGEFIPGDDGKMRYLKTIRQRMFRSLQQTLSRLAPSVPTYLCMEKGSVWEQAMPVQPLSNTEMESRIGQRFEIRGQGSEVSPHPLKIRPVKRLTSDS